jgi:hypothetical protein
MIDNYEYHVNMRPENVKRVIEVLGVDESFVLYVQSLSRFLNGLPMRQAINIMRIIEGNIVFDINQTGFSFRGTIIAAESDSEKWINVFDEPELFGIEKNVKNDVELSSIHGSIVKMPSIYPSDITVTVTPLFTPHLLGTGVEQEYFYYD